MKAKKYPLAIKVYSFSRKAFDKSMSVLNSFSRACFIGFWLGILKRETIHSIDAALYKNQYWYSTDAHNEKGLLLWEKEAIDAYFKRGSSILLSSAGAGREIFALVKLGYRVNAFECNQELVECGNAFLPKRGINVKIQYVPRDKCLESGQKHEGLIVGWGGYMFIQGRKERIEFLKKMRLQAQEGAPILLSFFGRSGASFSFKISAFIANTIRFLLGREFVQTGDTLAPHYYHYFTEKQLAEELEAAGFKLEKYCNYGSLFKYAVGVTL